jgi:hypothetical protein
VTISCNPDGTVHWTATVHNGGSCTLVNRHWKAQLQQHKNNEGGYDGVLVTRGTSNFPPGDTVISGNFCRNFAANVTLIRVEFSLDEESLSGAALPDPSITGLTPAEEDEDECEPHLKSASIPPCHHVGTCPTYFQDVQETNPYFDAVNFLNGWGAVSGYEDGTFRPYNNVTRAQVAKIVVLAFGFQLKAADTQRFSDVPTSDVFASYIETAYAHNLISGYEDGTFRPTNNVTRGQLAKIIVEAAGIKLVNPATPSFSDVPVDSTFFRYVETAKARGLMNGFPDGTFQAGAEANRGQVSKVAKLAAFPPQE